VIDRLLATDEFPDRGLLGRISRRGAGNAEHLSHQMQPELDERQAPGRKDNEIP